MLIRHTIPKENCNLHYYILPPAGQQLQCQEDLTILQILFFLKIKGHTTTVCNKAWDSIQHFRFICLLAVNGGSNCYSHPLKYLVCATNAEIAEISLQVLTLPYPVIPTKTKGKWLLRPPGKTKWLFNTAEQMNFKAPAH